MTVPENQLPVEKEERDVLGLVLGVIGFIAHGVVGLVYFAAAGLLAPLYGIAVLAVGWSLLLLVAIRWWSRHRRWIIVIPVIGFLYWLAIVSLGSYFLGWSA